VVTFKLAWHLVEGGIDSPPPFHRLGREARTIRPRGHWRGFTVFMAISKLNFKHMYIFEIIINDKDNFLRLMFVYPTSDVYLTLMFKFEIYSTNFREIITYAWPYINSAVMIDDNLVWLNWHNLVNLFAGGPSLWISGCSVEWRK
jgi:hypothetical protein